MHRVILKSSVIKKTVLLAACVTSLAAIWWQKPPLLKAAVPAEHQHNAIQILKLFRNIDQQGDAPLSIYFKIHYDGKTEYYPVKSYFKLAVLEDKVVNHTFGVTNKTPWNTMSIEIYDSRDQLIGSIGFDSKTWLFVGKSNCTALPYRLENVYPYEQYPTYAAPRGESLKCIGSGMHYIEITLRMLGD